MVNLISVNGTAYIKVGKHQIYQDIDNDGIFIVEKFEYEENGEDMFSVHDGYTDLVEAIKVASKL